MEQQQGTVSEITGNVGELTRIGQANATAAEEITATMLELSRLAERTRAQVDQFRETSRVDSGAGTGDSGAAALGAA